MGFPGGFSGKVACDAGDTRRFDPWAEKIPGEEMAPPTPGFLPGKFTGGGAWLTTVNGVLSRTRHRAGTKVRFMADFSL